MEAEFDLTIAKDKAVDELSRLIARHNKIRPYQERLAQSRGSIMMNMPTALLVALIFGCSAGLIIQKNGLSEAAQLCVAGLLLAAAPTICTFIFARRTRFLDDEGGILPVHQIERRLRLINRLARGLNLVEFVLLPLFIFIGLAFFG